jgi:hypothetical protein
VFSDRIDPVEIGQEWLDKQVCMVERAMDVRAGRNDGRVLDVHYHHLLEDPRGLIERVCDFAGIDLGPAEKEAIRVAQAQNRQHRHGIHRYRMEDFGLDLGLVRKRFARYCACYRVMEEA